MENLAFISLIKFSVFVMQNIVHKSTEENTYRQLNMFSYLRIKLILYFRKNICLLFRFRIFVV